MKKIKKIFSVFLVIAGVAVISAIVTLKIQKNNSLFGSSNSYGGSNIISSVTSNATSTAVGLPVKLLARNASRQYCYISNNSDTAVYLTFKNFESDILASTSVGIANGGKRLDANGGTFECLPEKMVVSDIWASSTASGKQILSGQQ